MGIWAGISALLHTAVGLNVHLRGKMWLYFVDTHHHLRRDAFGFGNYTGVLAALVFALLLALSNDVSFRRLGADRWKSLQRWAYAGIVLTTAHAIAYQQIEKRISPASKITALVLGWFENSVVRSDSRACGVARSFLPCAFVSIVW